MGESSKGVLYNSYDLWWGYLRDKAEKGSCTVTETSSWIIHGRQQKKCVLGNGHGTFAGTSTHILYIRS